MFKAKFLIINVFLCAMLITLYGCAESSSANDFNNNGVISVENKTITGVSEKGPFINGSSVTVQELNGKTLAQTGKSFKGKISSDKGDFKITSVNLESQYALLESNGFYRNEVTGKKSNAPITLNALTNLSKRENVNINLLTHLEYDRALYLIENGMEIMDAKKEAETEILNAFDINGKFNNSEDLSIFEIGDGNASLLAMSILMQGNLNEAGLSERLANFATDIREDGKWDDEFTMAQMADWAAFTNLTQIRANIESWNLGSVPEFEKYVRNFWVKQYGFEECNKKIKGKVQAVNNKHSTLFGTDIRFICKDEWVIATDFERDTYQWKKGEDGELKEGDSTKTLYKYDENEKSWIIATSNDSKLGFDGCTKKREGEINSIKDDYDEVLYYICHNSYWSIAATLEYDTYQEKCEVQGKKIPGKVNKSIYYYCNKNQWESLTSFSFYLPKEAWLNDEIDYGTFTDKRDGKTYRTIQIGTQTWMAENLNYADSASTKSLRKRSWCYKNNPANCDVAGRLYTWAAAIDSVALAANGLTCGYGVACDLPQKVQGICPEGWHLPDTTEWNLLLTNVASAKGISKNQVGKYLKTQNGWNSYSSSGNGNDALGFSALPAGGYYDYSGFYGVGYGAYFWSAAEYGSGTAYAVYMYYYYDDLSSYYNYKYYAYSVRCLMDPN